MGLMRVWRERKQVSPHRPKRVRTGFLVLALGAVLLAVYLLGRLA